MLRPKVSIRRLCDDFFDEFTEEFPFLIVKPVAGMGLGGGIGQGLFTCIDLPAFTVLTWYRGEQIRPPDPDDLEATDPLCHVFEIGKFAVDPRGSDTYLAKFINDSCVPNLCSILNKSKVFLYTNRIVERDEELTVDYAKAYGYRGAWRDLWTYVAPDSFAISTPASSDSKQTDTCTLPERRALPLSGTLKESACVSVSSECVISTAADIASERVNTCGLPKHSYSSYGEILGEDSCGSAYPESVISSAANIASEEANACALPQHSYLSYYSETLEEDSCVPACLESLSVPASIDSEKADSYTLPSHDDLPVGLSSTADTLLSFEGESSGHLRPSLYTLASEGSSDSCLTTATRLTYERRRKVLPLMREIDRPYRTVNYNTVSETFVYLSNAFRVQMSWLTKFRLVLS